MNIKMKKLIPTAILPTQGSAYAAGYDLYSAEDAVVRSGETVLIGTGLAMAIPEGFFGGIFARSGLASKQGLRPANCVGVIDADYRGEVKVALHNDSKFSRHIEGGERIAQLVVLPYLPFEIEETKELDETERGQGGFGSTGM